MPLPIKRIERTLENTGFSRVPLAETEGFEPDFTADKHCMNAIFTKPLRNYLS